MTEAPDPIAPALKPWKDRRYVNNLADLIGLEVSHYGTGNICYAALNGEKISNAAAGRILGAKVWLDPDDQVHVDYWTERSVITADQVKQAVAEAYAATQIS